MDSCDSDKQENKERKESEDGDPESYDWNVFQPFWIRCVVQNGVRLNRFILDYHRYFLPCCGVLVWSIFLLLQS